MAKAYTLTQKIEALRLLDEMHSDMDEVSRELDIPKRRLSHWCRQREEIQREYTRFLQDEATQMMAQVQYQAAEKALALINAIDEDRISKAPLNQLASAVGALVDRYLKLDDEIEVTENQQEKVIRIEYYDATTGQISETPPWAEADSEQSGEVQGGRLREALRQNGNGENHFEREGAKWDENVVVGSDVSDGKPSLARFEGNDDERDWYHD